MNLPAVYHETKSKYAYAFDENTLHLRVRTARNDIDRVVIVGGDPFRWIQSSDDPTKWHWDHTAALEEELRLEYQTDLFDYWFIAVQPQWKRFRYAFVLSSGGQEVMLGGRSFYHLDEHPHFRYETSLYFNFPYINQEDLFKAPAWVKETVWYQIFPERFADGDASNNPPGSLPWESDPQEGIHMRYGGDLQGILDHLDYLQDLGINGIYLTPIFESPSSHKYDTTDYYRIDPAFGDNALFKRLVEAAHARGMRIMLDAVFNHCGWLHPWWQDVIKNGSASTYFDCFFIEREPVINFAYEPGQLPHLTPEEMGQLNFRTFAFTPLMPKWNTDHPLVKEHLLGAIRYWTEEFGVDAWRLDVSNEVSHAFWREFRSFVQAINPQVYILGENWDNSTPWLQGDQFDGVMNYELTYPIWNLLGKPGVVLEPLDASGYQNEMNKLLVSYPKFNLPNMYNLVDSHDTPRIDFKCDGDARRVKLAYLLMLTFAGSASIYYGSEVGLAGAPGHNRQCMPWNSAHWDINLRLFVRNLVHLRRQHPAFGAVDLDWLNNSGDVWLGYRKESAGEQVYVFLNPTGNEISLPLPSLIHLSTVKSLIEDEGVEIGVDLKMPPFGFVILSD